MRKNQYLSNLLATTIICGAAGIATPAFAQDDAASGRPGRRPSPPTTRTMPASSSPVRAFRTPNLTAVSPVTVVNSQDIRLQGTTRTEDLINSLPQAFAGQGGNLANGATRHRDGQPARPRPGPHPGADQRPPPRPGRPRARRPPTSTSIPSSIVSRVDVLTGGASSVYGSDAVVRRRQLHHGHGFRGHPPRRPVQLLPAQQPARDTRHHRRRSTRAASAIRRGSVADGGTFDVSLAIGAGFDDGRGHVVAYAGYRKLERGHPGPARLQRLRLPGAERRPRSPRHLGRRLHLRRFGDLGERHVRAQRTGTSTIFQIGPNRTLIPGFTPYNFAPTNYFQRPDERYTFGAFANYEISPALRPYLEVMFMDDRTVAQIAPSGDFGNTFFDQLRPPGAPTVNAPGVGNPLLSAAAAQPALRRREPADRRRPAAVDNDAPVTPPAVFIDPTTGLPYTRGFAQILRRNVEGGGRRDDLQHTNLPHRRRHARRSQRGLVVRRLLPVRADQLRR